MSEGVASPSGAQSDAFTETDLSVEPFRLALTSSHPDRVKHVSQMPSVEQQRGPDTDSDSGDSLFITQKCVPERRRRSSKRSDFRTHRDASEHEYDTSSSEEEQRSGRKRRTEGFRTPRFTFPFLQKTLMTRLPYYQNRKLHYYAMGGYFRCVEELWESYQTGEGLAASSRTVDMDGEPLSPMSEEEHESAEGEELKVVEKKLFVASRAKRSQPWYNSKKTSSEETRQERSNAGSGSRRGQSQTPRQILTGASLSNETSYLKTKGSDESPGETELGNRRAPKAGNLPAEAETGKTNRSPRKKSKACDLFPKETGEPLVNENGAAILGLSVEQCGRESAEPHAGMGEQIYVGDDDERSRIKGKKGKKKEKRDKRGDERVDEEPAEGQPADPSLSVNVAEAQEAPCMEKKKKKKKKRESEEWSQKVDGQPEERKEDHSVSMWETEIGGQERRETKEGHTDSAAEPTADDGHVLKKREKKKKDPDGSSVQPQMPTEHLEAIDHLEDGEVSQEALDQSGFKRNKLKKKKKRRSLPDDNQTDVDLSNDAATVAEDTDSVKKKKPKKVSEPVRLPEQEESVDDAQKEKQDVELESRKKKKKKMRGDIGMNNAVDSLASSDNTELVRKKKKKRTSSFLSADTEEKVGQGLGEQGTPVRTASAHMGKSKISAGDLVAESADVSEHRQESKGVKKKKKRSAAPPESAEREAEETSEAGVKKKKKRKRTQSLTGGLESVADEERSPPAEAAAVRKKKKQKKGSQEVPADAAEHAESEKLASNPCGSLSSSQGKRRRSAETPCDSSLPAERRATETRLTEGAPGTVKERKKKKPADRNVAEGKSCAHAFVSETQQTRKDATKPAADPISTSPPTFPSARGTTSSRRIEGKTAGRVKRRLHNPEQDFLSEPSC